MQRAPFTDEQIAALNQFQADGRFHPYTCGNDSTHANLVATRDGWICPDCDYRQAWAAVFQAPATPCTDFKPDHNGECLNCDEWADAHDLPPLTDAVIDAFLATQIDMADPARVERIRARLRDKLQEGDVPPMDPDPICPRCGKPYPFGDPRSVVPGRQCFDCDERSHRDDEG